MTIKQLNEKIMSGVCVLTGRFQTYKAEATAKAGCNEKIGIVVGGQVLDFTVWAPKGTTVDKIPRPKFADTYGAVVCVIGATIKQDGKYLRCGAESVSGLEA